MEASGFPRVIPSLTVADNVVAIVVSFIEHISPLSPALAKGERHERARGAYPPKA
jgi:hypothetical protein